jgi:uncharacterized protein
MDFLILLAIGFASGVLGGLLGIGGSVVMIPAMTRIFGPAQHLYQGAAMIMNFFVTFPAAYQHFRARAILWSVIEVTVPTAVIGVLAGVWLSAGWWFRGANEVWLSRVFGGFLLYTAAYNTYRLFSAHRLPDVGEPEARAIPKWKTAGWVGLPMGLVGGLLGVGGGILAVPLQQVMLRIPLRRAIANSATTIILTSFLGAIYKNYSNACAGLPLATTLKLAAGIIPTAILGGFLGGRLTHVIPRRALRVAVILLMCYFGISMLARKAHPAPPSAASRPAQAARMEPGP